MPRATGCWIGSRMVVLGLWSLAMISPSSGTLCADNQLVLTFRNGTTLAVEVESFELNWSEFRGRGASRQQQFSLTFIDQLKLSKSPASELLDKVKVLLADLGHASYQRREEAEEALKNMLHQTANPTLRSMIEDAVNDPRLEVRFRAERILTPSGAAPTQVNAPDQFDVLTLKDGRQLRGDAGDFHLNFRWRGKPFRLNRREIAEMAWRTPPAEQPAPIDHWKPARGTQIYLRPPELRPHDLIEIDFEKDPFGISLERGANIDHVFTDRGVRFACEVGYIGISGYEISFDGMPARGNSICAYDTRGSFFRRFKGVTEISFCLPGFPQHAAGVHWFECYAARLDSPRDFVMDAFNAAGDLIASVESSDHPCGYFAVASAEPISLVRFQSNPYLFHLKRRVDDDYAIDNVAFSTPVATPPLISTGYRIVMKNGDLWCADSIRIDNYQLISLESPGLNDTIQIPFDEIDCIAFPTNRFCERPRNSNQWLALLSDGSIVEVAPSPELKPIRAELQSISRPSILAFWSARDYLRYPQPSDFDHHRVVLVFPTARILTNNLLIQEASFEWSTDQSARRYQVVHLKTPELAQANGLGVDEEPPLPPDLNSIQWPEPNSGHLPTVWLAPPDLEGVAAGPAVLLNNGERFVLAGSIGFRIQALTPAGLTIVCDSAQNSAIQLPLSSIRRIKF